MTGLIDGAILSHVILSVGSLQSLTLSLVDPLLKVLSLVVMLSQQVERNAAARLQFHITREKSVKAYRRPSCLGKTKILAKREQMSKAKVRGLWNSETSSKSDVMTR